MNEDRELMDFVKGRLEEGVSPEAPRLAEIVRAATAESFALTAESRSRRRLWVASFAAASLAVVCCLPIFNYMHYAHSAGYGLSKIQRKSSGSFILGFQYSKQEANLDASMFPSQLKHIVPEHFPDELRFHFKDYAISLGYAYNWVFHRNWLFNITAAPALGLKTIKEFPLDDKKSHITTNFRGRIALVYMKGKFFYGLNGSVNGYWFITKGYDFFANIVDFNAIIGVEF